uniref:Uncharacterized protein n=1 Tax=Rhizophora mucronata TaxID=61149 RepID=A0A2P2R1J9_RHIMU
MLLFAYFTL